MSKVIIVIDTPEDCIDCPCCNCTEHDTYCGMTNMYLEFNLVDGYVKPNWCPLKPIPDKIEHSIYDYDTDTGYTCGWNDCIDNLIRE